MPLTKLVYASHHGGLNPGVLDDILVRSRANNERDGITGVLVACEEDFMQLLEGERAVVAECMMRIMKDDRHTNIHIILAGETKSRLFPQWSLYSIEASQGDRDILLRYMTNGAFEPTQMSQTAIESLCRELSTTA